MNNYQRNQSKNTNFLKFEDGNLQPYAKGKPNKISNFLRKTNIGQTQKHPIDIRDIIAPRRYLSIYLH